MLFLKNQCIESLKNDIYYLLPIFDNQGAISSHFITSNANTFNNKYNLKENDYILVSAHSVKLEQCLLFNNKATDRTTLLPLPKIKILTLNGLYKVFFTIIYSSQKNDDLINKYNNINKKNKYLKYYILLLKLIIIMVVIFSLIL